MEKEPSSLWLLLALLLIVGMVPAMYLGALLARDFESFTLFPVPTLICLVLAGYAMHKAEAI